MNEYASSQGLAAFFTGRSLKINSSTSMHVQGDGLLRSVRKLNLKKWGKCMFRGRAASFSQCNLKIELEKMGEKCIFRGVGCFVQSMHSKIRTSTEQKDKKCMFRGAGCFVQRAQCEASADRKQPDALPADHRPA